MKQWKKVTKKVFATILAATMVFSLGACGSSGSTNETTASTEAAKTVTEATNETTDASTEEGSSDFQKSVLKDSAIKDDGTVLKVAFTVAELKSEYVIALQQYCQYLLEEAGADVTVSSADGDVEKQCNQIYDFIEKGVEVVMIQAADSNAIAPAVKACNEANVKVIAVGRAISGDCTVDYSAIIDDVEMGKMAADYIADNSEGTGTKVTTIQGTLGTASADDRASGFTEEAESKGLDVVRDNPCDWSSETAMSSMNDVMTSIPDVSAVFLHSDCMMSGVISALTQSEKLLKVGEDGHVMIVSVDGAASALDYIKQGYVDMTVDNSPLALATIASKVVLTKVVTGEELNEGIITVSPIAITTENVDNAEFWGNFNLDDGYWSETENVWNKYAVE